MSWYRNQILVTTFSSFLCNTNSRKSWEVENLDFGCNFTILHLKCKICTKIDFSRKLLNRVSSSLGKIEFGSVRTYSINMNSLDCNRAELFSVKLTKSYFFLPTKISTFYHFFVNNSTNPYPSEVVLIENEV